MNQDFIMLSNDRCTSVLAFTKPHLFGRWRKPLIRPPRWQQQRQKQITAPPSSRGKTFGVMRLPRETTTIPRLGHVCVLVIWLKSLGKLFVSCSYFAVNFVLVLQGTVWKVKRMLIFFLMQTGLCRFWYECIPFVVHSCIFTALFFFDKREFP